MLNLLQVVDGHICWQASTVLALWQVFAARFELHQQVYMHPTTKAAEALVADALVAANALLNLQDCCKRWVQRQPASTSMSLLQFRDCTAERTPY
jgi:HD superfamily phosphohydrolase